MHRQMRLSILSIAVLLSLFLSLARPMTAQADDSTPPPESTPATETSDTGDTDSAVVPTDPAPTEEIITDSGDASSSEAAPTAENTDSTDDSNGTPAESVSVSEALDQLPESTDLVVLDENGEALPLATQEAASLLVTGDPIWCPDGVAPIASTGGCTASYADLYSLINDINTAVITQPNANGTIWIQTGSDASASDIVIDGSSLGTWSNYSLTLQGGWSGTSGDTSAPGATTFSQAINIVNWSGDVTLKDLIFDNTSNTSVDVETLGNVAMDNVATYDSGGSGTYIDAGGDVSVQNSRFWDSSSSGIEAYSGGNLTLTDTYANDNGDDGAYLSADGNVTLSGGTFNNNSDDGIDAYSDVGNISVSNADAQYNDDSGVELDADGGAVSLSNGGFNYNSAYGIDIGDNGYADGNLTLSNIFTADNEDGGAYLYSGSGSVSITDSVFSDNYDTGLYVYYADTGITLTRVISSLNDTAGVQLTTPGNVSVSDSAFNRNFGAGMDFGYTLSDIGGNVTLTNVEASGNDDDGFQAYIDGDFTVNGGLFNKNDGYGINLYESEGAVSLSNVQAGGNTSDGAYLDNSYGTGNITIYSSVFNYNDGSGLDIYSAGDVSLDGVTANGNDNGNGAFIDNTAGSGSVSVADSELNNNHSDDGLAIYSAGAVTLTNVIADFNSSNGAYIDNSYGSDDVSINSSSFNANQSVGFYVNTAGNLSLYNVSAGANSGYGGYADVGGDITDSGTNSFNYNGSDGTDCSDGVNRGFNVNSVGGTATLDDCYGPDTNVWWYSGSTLYSESTIADALTSIASGLPPDGGVVHIDSALTPYYEDTSIDASSDADIAQITQLLGGGSDSTLIAGNLQFYNFTSGFSVSGLTLSQYLEAAYNTGAVNLSDVTAAGLETSSNNCDNDAGIDICAQDGGITLNGVNASGIDSGNGIHLDNTWSGTFQTISLMNTIFSGNNYYGLEAYAYGPMTLTGVDGSFNRYNTGAYLNNEYGSSSDVQSVQVSNSSFSNTGDHGLEIGTFGNITLTNVVANGNYSDGAYLYTDGDMGNITVNGGSFDYNYNNDGNYYAGLEVYNSAQGNISVSGVTAEGNYQGGLYLYNDYGSSGTGNVTVSNSNLNYNSYYGPNLTVYNYDNGDITLNNVTASGAYYENVYLEADGNTGNINIFNSTFNYSQEDYGLEVYNYATGNIFLSGVTANGNNSSGGYLNNDYGGTVTVLNSIFNNTVDDTGLQIYNAIGPVVVTSTIANGNDGDGAWIQANGTGLTVDPSTFNYNRDNGLELNASGDILLDHVTASYNGSDGVDLTAVGDASIVCSTFANNRGYGVVNSTAPTLTLNNVSFSGNSSGDYASTGSVTVYLTGDCNPVNGGGGGGGSPLTIPVTGGVGFPIDCNNPEMFTALLPDGDRALFSLLCGYDGVLTESPLDGLPHALPEEYQYVSGMDIGVLDGGNPLAPLPDGASVTPSFHVSDPDAEYAILYWNGSEWTEVEGGEMNEDGFFEAKVDFTGTFVLVSK